MRDQKGSVLEKYFSVFTRCSRIFFLYLHGTYSNERHGVTLPDLLGRLEHRLFTYLSYKKWHARCNAFRCAPFCVVDFYANYLFFQLFGKFFCVVLRCFSFSFWRDVSARYCSRTH